MKSRAKTRSRGLTVRKTELQGVLGKNQGFMCKNQKVLGAVKHDTTDGRCKRASTSSVPHAVMMASPECHSITPATVTGQHRPTEAGHPSTGVPSFGQKPRREGRAPAIRTEEPIRTDRKEDDSRAPDRVAKPLRLTRDGTTA